MLKASKHEAPPEIRSRRAVGDDDVDRAQVERRRRREPSATNSPEAFHEGDSRKRAIPGEKRITEAKQQEVTLSGSWTKGTDDACAESQGLRDTRPVARKSARQESRGVPRWRKRKKTKAVIARGIHLYPFRTEKLSHAAPMVLRKRESRSPPHYWGEVQEGNFKNPSLFFACTHPKKLFQPLQAASGHPGHGLRTHGQRLPTVKCDIFCEDEKQQKRDEVASLR